MKNTEVQNRSGYYTIQPANQTTYLPQSTPGLQGSISDNFLLMLSAVYVIPIMVLLGLCLVTHLQRKFKFRQEIQRLHQVATLERALRLKANKGL